MNAGYYADQIASHVNLCYPNDRDKLFKILTHIQNEIWRSGKYYGSTKWYSVKVFPDGQIATPHGHNVLLGIDVNKKPTLIRDETFLFHQNGPGDITDEFKSRAMEGVYDLGTYPVLFQPMDDETCRCRCVDFEPKSILVKADCDNFISNAHRTVITGLDKDGKNIYTYPEQSSRGTVKMCSCSEEQGEQFDGFTEGVSYPISSKGVIFKNIKFSSITSITKMPTSVPVEYWAVDRKGKMFLIARLEPYQIYSKYRRYKIPTKCHKLNCVLGLFKTSEPDPIMSENQMFISDNLEAIISLALYVDYKYDKHDFETAGAFLGDAARQLNSQLRENSSNKTLPIQVKVSHGFPKI